MSQLTTEISIDDENARYAFKYHGHLMTELERLADRHLSMTSKQARGRSDLAAQAEVKGRLDELRTKTWRNPRETKLHGLLSTWLSDDPAVLLLTHEGYEVFALRTGGRIMKEHRAEIHLNCCPRCGRVARTPQAQQCRYCRNDWHERPQP